MTAIFEPELCIKLVIKLTSIIQATAEFLLSTIKKKFKDIYSERMFATGFKNKQQSKT